MEYTLNSGFRFDVTNLLCDKGISEEDIENISEKIERAWREIQEMRKSGFIPNHLSKDGVPEPVYFAKLPYLDTNNQNLNTPATIAELIAWGHSLKNQVDAVISFGIGVHFWVTKLFLIFNVANFGMIWMLAKGIVTQSIILQEIMLTQNAYYA